MSSPNDLAPSKKAVPLGEAKHKAWSLAKTLAWSHVSLATLTVIGFALAMLWMQYRAAMHQVESELLAAAEAMKRALEVGVSPDKLSIPEPLFRRFGRAPRDHAYWVLWSRESKMIAWGGHLPEGVVVSQLRPIPPSPRPRRPRPFDAQREGRILQLMMDTNAGRLMIARPMAREFDDLTSLAIRLLGIILVAVSAAAMISVWVAKRIATPISEFAAQTRALTHSRLNQRIDVNQPATELIELASAFNSMLENLQRAFERQKQFTADAAHELRTPVSVVLAQSEHSLARPRSIEEYRSGFETTRATALHMRQLVQDLLDLARLDEDRLPLQFELVDLAVIGEQAVSMMQTVADDKSITIELAASCAMLTGDRLRLRQILLNLLSNAIEYSPQGARVWVTITGESDRTVMVVRDEGFGMSAEDQALVWNRFHRIDSARTVSTHSKPREQPTVSSGAGLGLSLVAELVRMHAGQIEMESAPGIGTTIKILFPVRPLP